MGRRESGSRRSLESLWVGVPRGFLCPISLEVMKSPVSLCTGISYDRASIQRWLDSGRRTCPVTAQPLPSNELVPNLNLRRLIQLWSSSSFPDTLPTFFSDTAVDDSEKNRQLAAAGQILKDGGPALEAAIKVLASNLTMDGIHESNKRVAISVLLPDLNGSASALVHVLKKGSSLESRIDSALVLDSILSSSSDCINKEAKISIAAKPDLIPELVRLISGETKMDPLAADAGLRCLVGIVTAAGPVMRVEMVRAGAVGAAARALAAEEVPSVAAERALRVMGEASVCGKGRAAICEAAEECVRAVMERVMRVGREGREAALGMLWAVCCGGGAGDRRAREAVAGASGGLVKILLLMQCDCSPAAAKMGSELLKIFPADAKSCFKGYDTEAIHVMPF